MSHRRRAVLLAGLALLLGTLAASDVGRRESALRAQLGPLVPVLVTRGDLEPGDRITRRVLAVRQVPARYAPLAAFTRAAGVVGARAAVAIASGTDVVPSLLADPDGSPTSGPGVPVRPGERVADLVARGSAELIEPGSRVDVLVTRDGPGGGRTSIALQDAEVLAASPAPGETGAQDGAQRVAVSLRVTLRQAVQLAQDEQYAREIRVLARSAGDRRHVR